MTSSNGRDGRTRDNARDQSQISGVRHCTVIIGSAEALPIVREVLSVRERERYREREREIETEVTSPSSR